MTFGEVRAFFFSITIPDKITLNVNDGIFAQTDFQKRKNFLAGVNQSIIPGWKSEEYRRSAPHFKSWHKLSHRIVGKDNFEIVQNGNDVERDVTCCCLLKDVILYNHIEKYDLLHIVHDW